MVDKIMVKLQAGQVTEDALAQELKEFDALLAAHKGEKTEDVARGFFMKAALYGQVFQNQEKSLALLREIKADFPGTEAAAEVDRVLTMIEQQKENEKLRGSLKPGTAFPDFAEQDLRGEPLSISKFKGKVVLVDFWATWCGPCVNELPNIIAAYQKYRDKGFEVIGISLDRDKAALETFIKEKNVTWPQYFDEESKLGKAYGINAIPATFLLDREGKIVATDLRGPALEAELEKLLGAK